MTSRSAHHRSKSTDVRRTLFRSLSRSTAAASGLDKDSSSSASSGLGEDDDTGSGSGSGSTTESIIVRKSDGTFDIEAPVVGIGVHEHLGLQEIEREFEQQRAVGRHGVDITKRLPELLRTKVLSLQQDNWMYEAEDEGFSDN